ncbi:MAG: hypothetical protein N2049_09310 [Anaerolineales bacterium]|nr:hypothetical protein [Anaerolineales bacterium]
MKTKLHSSIQRQFLFPSLVLALFIFAAACAPKVTPPPTPTPRPPSPTATPVAIDTPPTEPYPTLALLPSPTVTPRGNELVATDPSTVRLASGQLQLIEFFRFT